jgi:uncharacterized protein YbjQ (UPF0145 family)
VTLKRGEHDWARGSVDFVVSGTAIRTERSATETRSPALSNLSVQDYWKLTRGGWEPAGLVAATAVFFVSRAIGTQWRRRATVARNQELSEYSRGFSATRQTAVRDLRSDAKRVGAAGIVGVGFDHDVSRATLRVAVTTTSQATGISPTTLAMGADYTQRGRDSRSGIVVTIQAVGTAIRRQTRAVTPAPAVMQVGMST